MNGRNSSFCFVGKEGPSSEKQSGCQKQQMSPLYFCDYTCSFSPKTSELKNLMCEIQIHFTKPQTKRGS